MFDDLAAYFYENVVTAFEEYLSVRATQSAGRSKDVRSGVSAASALYHLREHLPSTYPKTRTDVVNSCPDYALLGDVVNASKHRTLTKGTPQLTNADSIEELVIITEYEDEQGSYKNVEKEIAIKLSNGTVRILAEVMTNVMNFWKDELYANGIISENKHYSLVNRTQPLARAACNNDKLDLEIKKGLRFKQNCSFRKFNYSTNQIEPIDLTGANVRMRIYQPKYDVDISLKNGATGEELSRTVSLTSEESERVTAIENEEERQEYLISLPQVATIFDEFFQPKTQSENSQIENAL